MGWEIHITRAEYWPLSEQNPIRQEEWLALIEADPELVIDPFYEGTFARWLAHKVGRACEYPWFDWHEGRVFTKHPDNRTIAKMLEIASKLSAQVQGDDGERYM